MPTLKSLVAALVNVFLTGSTAALASGSNAISGVIDPTAAAWGNYERVRWSFTGTFGATPTGTPYLAVYYLLSRDGGSTNFETDPGRSTTPVRSPAAVIPLDIAGATQSHASEEVDLPDVPFKVIFVNSSGQSANAGWLVDAIPCTDQA
jgi:hypothetical protein